jgi:hypothetical protein
VFQSRRWLEAPRRTYRYVPVALTTRTAAEELQSGILERMTGCLAGRVVSLLPDRLFVAVGASLYRHVG